MKHLILIAALPTGAFAQSHDHAAAAPTEAGQGGFAALAEVVEILAKDPLTDWSRVDIDGLRLHLQDMDALVTEVEVSRAEVPEGLVLTIARTSPGTEAAWRMVPAHAPVLAAETGWTSTAEVTEDVLTWTVTDPAGADQIRALGFFGLMATGNHHAAHHLALARGGGGH